jgi:hypothetical protein
LAASHASPASSWARGSRQRAEAAAVEVLFEVTSYGEDITLQQESIEAIVSRRELREALNAVGDMAPVASLTTPTVRSAKGHRYRRRASAVAKRTSSPIGFTRAIPLHDRRDSASRPTVVSRPEEPQITIPLPRFVLPLLPPGAGNGGSTHDS